MSYNQLRGFDVNGLATHPSLRYGSVSERNHPGQAPSTLRISTQPDNQYTQSTQVWNSGREQNSGYVGSDPYRNHNWQNAQTASYNYPQPPAVYQSNSSSTTTASAYNSQYNTPSSHHNAAHGLSRLAYASGLEPSRSTAESERRRDSFEGQQKHHATNGFAQAPDQGTQHGRVPSALPTSNAMRQQRSGSSSSSHRMAIDAATALAGVVQDQGQNRSERVHVSQSHSNNPTARTLATRSPQSRFHTVPSRPSRQSMSQGQQEPGNGRVHPVSPLVQANIIADVPVTSTQADARNQESLATNSRGPDQHSHSAESAVSDAEDPAQDFYQDSEADTQVAHYVDPMQVFNPFHREYEQKRKDAIEAKARQDATKTLPTSSTSPAKPAAVKKKKDKAITKSQSPVAQNKSKAIMKSQPHEKDGAQSSTGFTSTDESDMAAELKAMMEKMKSLRSKDPSLFQKVVSEFRGKDGGVTTIVSDAQAKQARPAESDMRPHTSTTAPQAARASVTTPSARFKTPSKSVNELSNVSDRPANGYRVVVENNLEGLPDLGRFPAERRIRQSYRTKERTPNSDTGTIKAQVALGTPAMSPMPFTKPPAGEAGHGWPASRRKAVGEAAIKLLKASPENQHNPTTAQDICVLLESNPSYTDLCIALERRGLKFQRTAFARSLLQNIPDLNAKSTTNSKRDNVMELSNVIQSEATVQPLQNFLAADIVLNAAKPQSTDTPGLHAIKSEKLAPPRIRTEGTKLRNDVGVKEAAARKRDFSELIDLTQLNDDDNYVMPDPKRPKFGAIPADDGHNNTMLSSLAAASLPTDGHAELLRIQPVDATPLRFNPRVEVNPMTQPGPSGNTLSRSDNTISAKVAPSSSQLVDGGQQPQLILAREIDQSEAMQKSYYDPRTVARDILIASGKHPSEQPLNVHLKGLLHTYIEVISDLSTFDWDAIDPGGPPLRKVEYGDVVAIPPKFKIGVRRKRRHKQTTPHTNKGTKHSQTHVPSPTSTDDHNSLVTTSLTTKDVVDAGDKRVQSEGHLPRQKGHRSVSRSDVHPLGQVTPQSQRISVNVPDLTQRTTPQTTRSLNSSYEHQKMEIDGLLPKRRGRPPGAKNKHPSTAKLKKIVIQNHPVHAVPEDAPPSPTLSRYRCKWVRCGSELHNLDTLRKHIAARHRPTEEEAERVGYTCWWKKCQFLHLNEDKTIQAQRMFEDKEEWMAHIDADHLQPVALKYGDGPGTNTGKPQSLDFNVSRFLYKPPVGSPARNVSYTDPQTITRARERFLSDENGRATTPAINIDGSPHLPQDVLDLSAHHPNGPQNDSEEQVEKAQKAFMKAHGVKLGDHRKRAEETIRAMAVRKMKIGPGIDRGGCTLINEARRATLLQAPGIARIIDAPY